MEVAAGPDGFTRRHYEAIAGVILTTAESFRDRPTERATLRFLARDMADMFESGSPRFDRARFLAACGAES